MKAYIYKKASTSFLDRIFTINGIIAESLRDMIAISPAAKRLTRWNIGNKVPYCENV
jgi:hypothetical protein